MQIEEINCLEKEIVVDYLANILSIFSFHSLISGKSKSDDRIVFLTHFGFCRDFLHFGTVS